MPSLVTFCFASPLLFFFLESHCTADFSALLHCLGQKMLCCAGRLGNVKAGPNTTLS